RAPLEHALDQWVVRTHLLLPEVERVRQPCRLVLGVDGGLGEERKFERIQGCIPVLAEALGVRLGGFRGKPDQLAGDREQVGVESNPTLKEIVGKYDLR